MKNISIIVAIADNMAIGKDNRLLCHLSDDLIRFRRLTTGHMVVMGKKTYYSLPKRPLPGRVNMVLTDIHGEQIDDCLMAYSLQDALEKMEDGKEHFVIGGGSVYAQFLPQANRLYITWVHHAFDADTFFPELSKEEWEVVSEDEHAQTDDKNPYPYTYSIYQRKKPAG